MSNGGGYDFFCQASSVPPGTKYPFKSPFKIKKLMSWKTSLFGLMAAIGAAIVGALATGVMDPHDFPLWLKKVALLMAVIGGAGTGFFARDNDKSSEQVGAGGQGKVNITNLSVLLLLCCLVAILAGCAFNRQYATTTASNPTNGVVSVTVARSTTLAVGDAKTVIEKTRASAGKTSAVGASGINEEATTANVATNARAITELLNALKTP